MKPLAFLLMAVALSACGSPRVNQAWTAVGYGLAAAPPLQAQPTFTHYVTPQGGATTCHNMGALAHCF